MKFYNDIFAIPIIEYNLGIDNKKIIKHIKSMQKKSKGSFISNKGGWKSKELSSKDPIFKPIMDHVTKGIIEYAKRCLFKPGEYSIRTLEANVNGYKDHNEVHLHQYCIISGVYFLNAPKDCGDLLFRNPSLNLEYDWHPSKMIGHNSHNSSVYHFVPEEGKLLLFPPWVEHLVRPNLNKKEERISLSFNVVHKHLFS
tara:strand:- start:521 stop:1114 length:594 start_codon:yes stop_codon:yes gene_type:complete